MKITIPKQILGVIILPFVVTLFILDRVISMPIFWITNLNFKTWISKDQEVFYSLIRVIAGSLIYLIITIFKFIF